MDVNHVLEGTLSADAETRKNSEQQLNQAADANFSQYLVTLVQCLVDDQASSTIRTAAGLALKNRFTFRDSLRIEEVSQQWMGVEEDTRKNVKSLALKTLEASDSRAAQAAAQFIASIASIELPKGQWPDLMTTLVNNVSSPDAHRRQASLTTIGFICENPTVALEAALAESSNAILTAVVQGARKEEENENVRVAAVTALSDSLSFVGTNFRNEGERNYIMQVVCEATQAPDNRIQEGAWGCLNRIMGIYYEFMQFYMEKALYGLTIQGMKSEEEDVAKLAIEFWSTVCEEEQSIADDNREAEERGQRGRTSYNFAAVATSDVVPHLLELMSHQEEDALDDEYNVSRAAYQCLTTWSQVPSTPIVAPVITFVEKNLRSEDWHLRDAAVSAFGAIMEGPAASQVGQLVEQALPVIIGMMNDDSLHVRDSTAYTLGRICDFWPTAISQELLAQLIGSLFNGLSASPRMASSCCWALQNLGERFSGDLGAATNPISPHFKQSVASLLQVTERMDADSQLRTAAYEVLNTFVTYAANDSLPLVAELSNVVLKRLEDSIGMQGQVVSAEDRIQLEDLQTSLTSVVMAIILRLEREIHPLADRIMQLFLQLLTSSGPKSSVPDTVLGAVGSLANAVEGDFEKYMEAFAPYLVGALQNREEPSLCAMAIGLVGDITRVLGEKVQPYCDQFMNHLLEDLQSDELGHQVKPAILQCFGDIAQAIGPHFQKYFVVVAQILVQASAVGLDDNSTFEQTEYVMTLREGIMDAWDGSIIACKVGGNTQALAEKANDIFDFIGRVFKDFQLLQFSDGLIRSAMGVLGDLADTFPNGELTNAYRQEWVLEFSQSVKKDASFDMRTRETARWARDQIRRQIGGTASQIS